MISSIRRTRMRTSSRVAFRVGMYLLERGRNRGGGRPWLVVAPFRMKGTAECLALSFCSHVSHFLIGVGMVARSLQRDTGHDRHHPSIAAKSARH
ncbi:hypothetical protein BCR44DRAFT_1194344 [Catenaria anguillulae PL171]|uniref:Uncharacterized protein n=1 Tax=Catenaria anguillulae PL171 TaxID=765915 RepID=A0A1Y2HG75_9FUNG|nr:hypothetical protein BCR44DRAFT_1194344 [Catenaria anguillulae PL171]